MKNDWQAVEMSIDHSATTDKERLRIRYRELWTDSRPQISCAPDLLLLIRQEHPNDPTCISERWDEYVEEYAWFVSCASNRVVHHADFHVFQVCKESCKIHSKHR